MILLRETTGDSHPVMVIHESTSGGKKTAYIEGIFAQAEKKNRNGRIYPRTVLSKSVSDYNGDYILKKRALGEISHPDGRPQVKPELASHLVTSLVFKGDDIYGKAKILETPQGNILRGLLEGGVQMGVSTRGLGSVTERQGTAFVNNDYVIMAIDAVTDPSGVDCFVEAVNESKEWLITGDGQIVEKMQRTLRTRKLSESQKYAMLQNYFNSFSTTV